MKRRLKTYVILLCVVLLVSYVLYQELRRKYVADVRKNRTILNNYSYAVKMYSNQYGCLPGSEQELIEDANGLRWVEAISLLDAWGNKVEYNVKNQLISISSPGKDNEFGSADDSEVTFQYRIDPENRIRFRKIPNDTRR